jgi:hypothetical protein
MNKFTAQHIDGDQQAVGVTECWFRAAMGEEFILQLFWTIARQTKEGGTCKYVFRMHYY